jgi:hypothetical protein
MRSEEDAKTVTAALVSTIWRAWGGWGFRHLHVPRIREKAMKMFEGVDVPVRQVWRRRRHISNKCL